MFEREPIVARRATPVTPTELIAARLWHKVGGAPVLSTYSDERLRAELDPLGLIHPGAADVLEGRSQTPHG